MKAYFVAVYTYILYLNRDHLCYFTNHISQYLVITDTNLFALFLSGALGKIRAHIFSHPTGIRSFHLSLID